MMIHTFAETIESVVPLLLSAPDSQIDKVVFPLIEKWTKPIPKAIEILEVLDKCIYSSLSSGFVINVLETLYVEALKVEGSANADVAKLATWRNPK